MSYDIKHLIQLLEMSNLILGKTVPVEINSNIYSHYSGNLEVMTRKEVKKDKIIIQGSIDNPIQMNDIIKAFNKMYKQFKNPKFETEHSSYFYEGIKERKPNSYELRWGT